MTVDDLPDKFDITTTKDIALSLQELTHLNGQSGEPSTPFLQTNETVFQHTMDYLAITRKQRVSTMHVGVSGLQNLDMIAARRSGFGVLVDINPNMQKVMGIVKDICIGSQASRQDFVDVFIEQVSADAGLWDDESKKEYQISNFRRQSRESWSWLSSDEGYNHIKSLFLNNKIISINLDFANVGSVERISRWAQQNGISIDTVYLSNIFEWNQSENARKLLSLAKIGQNDTLVLSSHGLRGELTAFGLEDHPYFHIDRIRGVASLGGDLQKGLGGLSTPIK